MQACAVPDAHRMLLDGERVDSASGATIPILNPASRSVFAHVPRAGAEDVDRAVKAAAAAFASWRDVPPRERGRMLLRIADSIEAKTEELARTVATETGNALRTQARPEAGLTADIFRYFGGLASELKGETLPLGEHLLSYTRREPIGVVGAIIPWNAPVLLAALKIAPALCTGNTVVLKAAEDAPLGVLMLAGTCQEHLPPGVLNVLTGYGHDCGAALGAHPGVRKLSFTGSTEVGKLIMEQAARRVVPVSLELGGKSPSIVFPDANEDWAVEGIIGAMRFTRQSQSCTAGSRLFLHASIFDEFLEKLVARTSKLRLGDPLDESTDMGAIINEKQFTKVCGYIEEGLGRSDARLAMGGLPPETGPLSEGFFARPTIFADASNDWRLAREEIFGPCSWPSAGRTSMTRSAWRTTATTGSRRSCGRATSGRRCAPRTGWRRAGCRSTRARGRCWASPTEASSRAGSGGVFIGGHARQLHPEEVRDGEPGAGRALSASGVRGTRSAPRRRGEYPWRIGERLPPGGPGRVPNASSHGTKPETSSNQSGPITVLTVTPGSPELPMPASRVFIPALCLLLLLAAAAPPTGRGRGTHRHPGVPHPRRRGGRRHRRRHGSDRGDLGAVVPVDGARGHAPDPQSGGLRHPDAARRGQG